MSELTQITPNDQGRSEHELQQAIDFYGVFLAMAGHDLRQPLQTIMSTFEWLVRRLHTTSEQEYLRRGRSAVTRLSEQLDLLIEAMRLHEHSANVQPASVALTPIFLRLCSDNEDLAIRKGITLRVQRTRAAVMSDAILLEGILRNLVRNALNMLAPADGFWLAAVAWHTAEE